MPKSQIKIIPLLLIFASTAFSSIIVTAEKPNATTTSAKTANVFSFNNLRIGENENVIWSGIGKFDNLYVQNSDIYGGAGGTKYALNGAASALKTTLTLNAPMQYFGLWWSAMDSKNVLEFYLRGNLIAEFSALEFLKVAQGSYFGNPSNKNADSGEAFAYLNFVGKNTTWDEIVFKNVDESTGFEYDNVAASKTAPVLKNQWKVQEIVCVPESRPMVFIFCFASLLLIVAVLEHFRLSK